jgi:hypothetical protein
MTEFKNNSKEHEVHFSELTPTSGSKTSMNLYNSKPMSFNNKSTHPFHTTLMIKNIPNRLTQNILLNYIDEGFLGCYDFF